MKIKGKALCKIAVMLSIIMAVSTALPVNAKLKDEDKVMKISKKEAVEFALKNNVGMKRIDAGIDTAMRKLRETQDISNEVKKLENALSTFKTIGAKYLKLKESPEFQKYQGLMAIKAQIEQLAKNPTPENIAKIGELKKQIPQYMLSPKEQETLNSMMPTKKEEETFNSLKTQLEDLLGPGFMDRKMSKKDEYNMIVKPRDIYWYQVQGKLRQAKLLKESTTKRIELGVNELYNGVLQMQEGYDVKKKLYDKQSKEYDLMLLRKKVGDASEIERIVAYIELKKLSFDLSKMQREIDNLQIKLKKLMGVAMNQNIELIDKNTDSDNIIDIKDYDIYLKDALSNRSEISNAKVELDVKQWEFDKMEDYFYDDDMEYKELEESIDETKDLIEDTKNDICRNIEFAYNDVVQKRHDIELARQKLDEMNVQYEAAYNGYKQGVKPLTLTWTVELGKAKSEFDLKIAIMNYNNAARKLEAASKIGPNYETREGAK